MLISPQNARSVHRTRNSGLFGAYFRPNLGFREVFGLSGGLWGLGLPKDVPLASFYMEFKRILKPC